MNNRDDVFTTRILTLLKIDANNLFNRLKSRENEYLAIFSQKRTRDHFKEIFISKYPSISMGDLKYCSEDVIISLDAFYTKVDDMRWYLYHTDDMPVTVDDNVRHFLRELKELYSNLMLYLQAELDPNDDGEGGDEGDGKEDAFDLEQVDLIDLPDIDFDVEENEQTESSEESSDEVFNDRDPSKNLAGEDTILGVFNKEDLKDL